MSAAVLDPCCGSRMMWFDRADQRALFGDTRDECITVTDNSRGNKTGQRVLEIHPDIRMDFRAMPFKSESFALVVFDPPHLVQAGPRSWLAAKYGKLGADWRDDLRQGFAECFRVLKPSGVLIFKWAETQIPLREILALTPEKPLFGHRTNARKAATHWMVFMKGGAA
jgi:SAM-dependent methyltransferase